ncbi:MAG: LptA/OstA family protein [Pseudomonadota bacterium]
MIRTAVTWGMRTCLLVFVLSLALPAAAQTLSALKQHDVDQPIDISAEQVEVRERENVALFGGMVEVTQGRLKLFADSLRVYYEPSESANVPITRLDVQGRVKLNSPSERVEGDWGIYDIERELVTMGGAVKLTRGETVIQGTRLELDLRTGLAKLDGRTGRGARVRGQFSVPPSSRSPAASQDDNKP